MSLGRVYLAENTTKIQKAGEALVSWYRNRLKEVFGYVSTAREIRSSKDRPLYYLIFAGPNETGAKNSELRFGTGCETYSMRLSL